jgi:hypothetical protein
LEELAGGLDSRQTGDRHHLAQARLQALLAMEVQGSGRLSEVRQGDSWADQLENVIKSLTTASLIKRFDNTPIEKFVDEVKKSGAGLYIVGLDIHVGFILNNGEEIYFVHSSYVEPKEVIREKAAEPPILSTSKYRVIGKISADDQLMTKWLNQTAIPTLR